MNVGHELGPGLPHIVDSVTVDHRPKSHLYYSQQSSLLQSVTLTTVGRSSLLLSHGHLYYRRGVSGRRVYVGHELGPGLPNAEDAVTAERRLRYHLYYSQPVIFTRVNYLYNSRTVIFTTVALLSLLQRGVKGVRWS